MSCLEGQGLAAAGRAGDKAGALDSEAPTSWLCFQYDVPIPRDACHQRMTLPAGPEEG